jgi:hypothetical protein
MKKSAIILLCCLWALFSNAQQIVQAEYFIDTDPGNGNGTPISVVTPGNTISESVSIPTASLSLGNHYLWIRTKNDVGVWSHYYTERFYVYETSSTITIIPQPPIVAAEYFIDTDPGNGNGTPITVVSAADTIFESISIPSGSLSIGNHYLWVRTKNANGVWSHYMDARFYVYDIVNTITLEVKPQLVSAEYFIDTDPGVGNGIPLNIAVGDTSGLTFNINTLNIPVGSHFLYIRAKDADGIWGIPTRNEFDVQIYPIGAIVSENISVDCFGQCNGSATVTPTGGVPTWSFLWTTSNYTPMGITDSIATNLCAGTYYCIVQDSNNDKDTIEVIISQPAQFAGIPNPTHASCGLDNGVAAVSITGGTAPYSYLWSNNETTASLTNVQGNLLYQVTITDANNCTANSNVFVNAGPAITVSLTENDPSCFGFCNGSLVPVITGGTPPFSFFWNNAQTTPDLTGLCPGNYSVNVTDNSGCIASASAELISPSLIEISSSINNADCGTENGIASITVSGGIAPYTYNWTSGSIDATATNLASGIYQVTVTDLNLCVSSEVILISDANGPVVTLSQLVNPTCNNSSDGSIDITVAGSTGITYLWSNGATSQDVSGLTQGPYEVIVTDNNGCNTLVEYVLVSPMVLSTSFSIFPANCGVADGVITSSVLGGTPPYTYQWSTGGSFSTESGVPMGLHSLLITDANSCSLTSLVVMSEANGPVVTVNTISETACGNEDGGVSISATGGTGTYNYSWSNNTFNQNLTNVGAGVYQVTVTDQANCSGLAVAEIPSVAPSIQEICLVTVDPSTGTNLLVWEKPIIQGGIASYNIYRETSQYGVFQLIANQPYSEESIYTDPIANPQIRSWRYKIAAVDTCGNISDLSPHHKNYSLSFKSVWE